MEVKLEQLDGEFRKRFSSRPRFFRAPGRVNLIGEHTDYNDGFVMPFAIDRQTVVAAAARKDSIVNAVALDLGESAMIDLTQPAVKQRRSWIDYVEGTVRCAAKRFGEELRGADLVLTSSVPMGAGLSSSAAIEIAVGYAILSLNDVEIDRRELALAAQQAEHEFVGTRSGIMDQFTSVFAEKGSAILLDCRSLEINKIPLEFEDAETVAIDTGVKHELASSEYNTRRAECETGVRMLQKKMPDISSLRDVTLADLDRYGDQLADTILRRCRHVVTENVRTLEAADKLKAGEFAAVGKLMTASHASLRDDYEVSCAELDYLVDTALTIEGVYGARMTGGGFGGCTVTLVRSNAIEELRTKTYKAYKSRFGIEPVFYLFNTADGASEITA